MAMTYGAIITLLQRLSSDANLSDEKRSLALSAIESLPSIIRDRSSGLSASEKSKLNEQEKTIRSALCTTRAKEVEIDSLKAKMREQEKLIYRLLSTIMDKIYD